MKCLIDCILLRQAFHDPKGVRFRDASMRLAAGGLLKGNPPLNNRRLSLEIQTFNDFSDLATWLLLAPQAPFWRPGRDIFLDSPCSFDCTTGPMESSNSVQI